MDVKIWTCIVLVSVTFGIYYQTSDHDFINYDDPSYIINNPYVNTGLNINNISWAFTSIHASNWHPVTWLSHMLDIELFGLDPKGQHLVNVVIHLLNSLILYLLLFGTTKSHWKSSFVAALFALHPLHVESVAWVAERKDVLSAFFFFITLISYHWYVSRPDFRRYVFTLFAFALGLMSKPMLVTLPFVLLLMDYWPLQRISLMRGKVEVQDSNPKEKEKLSLKQLILEKLPFLSISALSCIITFYAQSRGGAVAKIKLVPIYFRIMNALVVYVDYIFKMIWPQNLSVIYPLPDTITLVQGLGSGLFLAAISVIFICKARKNPYLIVGWLWYIGMLVPVIGLVQVGRQSMADRYTYLPLTGLFIIAAWGVPSIIPTGRHRNMILSIMAGLFLLMYSLFTLFQLSYWKSSLTLFRHATQIVPKDYLAYNLIGVSLANKGDLEGAIPYFWKAVYLEPNSAECHSDLGFALTQLGKDSDGIHHLIEAIRIQPDNPKNADIHFHIGTSFARLGEIDQSIDHFNKAIQIKPDFVEAHYDLGVAFAKQGKWDQAIAGFSMALQLKPDLAEAAMSLKKAKRMKGK